MSKSVLTIQIYLGHFPISKDQYRTIEVPCRLPEAFTFWFKQTGYGNAKASALLSGFDEPKTASIAECELSVGIGSEDGIPEMSAAAERILAIAKATLGITGPIPADSPLQSIAIAYEAECAAYEAQTEAYAALPNTLRLIGMLPPHPSEDVSTGIYSRAARMLAKYVEHVFEQAAKAHEEKP